MNELEAGNILDEYLDGALDAGRERDLLERLRREPALAAELAELKEGRALRASLFASLEPAQTDVDAFVASVITRKLHEPRRTPRLIRLFRPLAAAAACVAVGFAGGYVLRPAPPKTVTSNPPNLTTPADPFRVAITDDAGRVLGVQAFDSIEKAREFSEDLRRWQQWQEQLRSPEVVVRSASF